MSEGGARATLQPATSETTARPNAPHVTFSTLYRDSLIDRADDDDVNERSALLAANHDPHQEEEDDEDEVNIQWSLKGFLVSIGVVLSIAAIIVAAVWLRNGERWSAPTPRPPTPKPSGFPPSPFPSGRPRNPAYLIKAQNGAVASETETCSKIGVEVLKEGGNAVDAAIASNLCIGTVNMFSSGIGGGGFATIRIPPPKAARGAKAKSTVYTVDFRETAPAASNATMYASDHRLSRFGGLAVGTPGELRGLEEMHRRWGKLSWKRLIEPSIKLSHGWQVTTELDRRLQRYGLWMPNDPDWKPTFAPTGVLLSEGQWISRAAYGQTLATIAEHGADAFYKGPIAEAIVAKVRSKGGILTLEDLAAYKPIVQRALEGTYRGRKVYTTHAPTSGTVVLHILNVLESFDLVGEGRTVTNVHRMVEALKFGFAARTKIADPKFLDDTSTIAEISTKEFAASIAANITDDQTHEPEYYHPVYDVLEDHGTTHTSVVDKDGLAVGLTSTINLIFGSQVLDTETGVILNDEMDDFSTPGTPNAFGLWPSPYNYPAGGKRPLSSTAATIIERENGDFLAVLGGSGGSRIFGSIVQVILGLDWGLDISQAIEHPRVHDQLFPQVLNAESTGDQREIDALIAKGHNVVVSDINLGVAEVQGVYADENGVYYAASDSRKNGVAAGY